MAKLAVLASGSGSNFEAIAEAFAESGHEICCLICDRRDAYAFKRAEKFGIQSFYISYYKRERADAELEIISKLEECRADLIALAGFMRLLTPVFVDHFQDRIINIHPSLLPKYPGTHGIQDSFESEDTELGITIHRIDHGLDTGPIIMQKSFSRVGNESLDEIETRIHDLEHQNYPAVLLEILDAI
ncbi:MAG: phosphoribosylglycinamide formyltransferase [Spirochaetales bacterium]|uniref:Phosphoribosylglycinamide formyltransferase n=1 Tax=Candidatus Thalassospirochaeta sargassi TaxID=3119039 RepID=A0AAJ1MM79_9SPIO|nr:phosphoribosylglycinamide formyltransferase [Spirochaetales bacterium]